MEAAMRTLAGEYAFTVVWSPFLLRSGIPLDGHAKAPETATNKRVGTRLKTVGDEVGINFTGKCDRYPNTLLAHALLEHLHETAPAVQDAMSERLFHGYFTDGNSGYPDRTNLVAMAAEVDGVDAAVVGAFLAQAEADGPETGALARVARKAAAASRSGISGVPFFRINGHDAFSGAQGEETFVRAFRAAASAAAPHSQQ
jgi:predicted DsbA family dithiol-disulfide isomerase